MNICDFYIVLDLFLAGSLSQYAVAVVEDSDGQLLLKQRPQTGREREQALVRAMYLLYSH